MDGNRFDALTRAFGARQTRRAMLRTLAGGLAVAAAAVARPNGGEAAKCGREGESCGCCKGGLTCTGGTCCPNDRVCGGACCAAGNACQDGACVRAGSGSGSPGGCPAGQALCNGSCLAITNDVTNCGACGSSCPASTDPCLVAVCTAGICGFTAVNEGGVCTTGNLCTTGDFCQGGLCTAGPDTVTPTCTALDQCHDAGVCVPATGKCTNPDAENGISCNDITVCTQGDTCQQGQCMGGTALVCTASGPCMTVSCDATMGCVETPKAVGTICADTDRCDGEEACDGDGNCLAGTPVSCDPCNACDAATGTCAPTNEGGTCTGVGNLCFGSFVCRSGGCVGTNPVSCSASDQCHIAGTCVPGTGRCTNPDAPAGTTCNDGTASTCNDACLNGLCTGGPCTTCPTAAGTINCAAGETCAVTGLNITGSNTTGCCPAGGVLCDLGPSFPAEYDLCCPAGDTCQTQTTVLGATIARCSSQGQTCPSNNGTSVTCAAGETCAVAPFDTITSMQTTCCPAGGVLCDLGPTVPYPIDLCCPTGATCVMQTIQGNTFPRCSTQGDICPSGGGLARCGPGETCAYADYDPLIGVTQPSCCPADGVICELGDFDLCCPSGDTCQPQPLLGPASTRCSSGDLLCPVPSTGGYISCPGGDTCETETFGNLTLPRCSSEGVMCSGGTTTCASGQKCCAVGETCAVTAITTSGSPTIGCCPATSTRCPFIGGSIAIDLCCPASATCGTRIVDGGATLPTCVA